MHAHGWDEAQQLVVDSFANNDVVLLGEEHLIRENLQFVGDLVPVLHANGIYRIGIEFGAEEFQSVADDIVNGETYREDLSRHVLLGYNVGWPYREYHEIYKAVWAFNRTLASDQEPMRIIHTSYVYDWSRWVDGRTSEAMSKIFHRGYINEFRANLIAHQVVHGHKVLGLFGAFHCLKGTGLPHFENWYKTDKPALGQILEERLGGRVASLALHPDFDESSPRHDSVWSIAGAWDGYISLTSELHPCALDSEFLDEVDFELVQNNWPDPDWNPIPAEPETYWSIARRRLSH